MKGKASLLSLGALLLLGSLVVLTTSARTADKGGNASAGGSPASVIRWAWCLGWLVPARLEDSVVQPSCSVSSTSPVRSVCHDAVL